LATERLPHRSIHAHNQYINAQDLRSLGWPYLSITEDQAITKTTQDGPKLAIGGSAIITKKGADISVGGPPVPGYLCFLFETNACQE
jgi:hypothetical protein